MEQRDIRDIRILLITFIAAYYKMHLIHLFCLLHMVITLLFRSNTIIILFSEEIRRSEKIKRFLRII